MRKILSVGFFPRAASMSFKSMLLATVMFGALGVGATQAQDLGDLFGAFGGMIENIERSKKVNAERSFLVKRIQSALRKMELYKGSVDGSFGPGTRSALSNYFQRNGLPQPSQITEFEIGELEFAADRYTPSVDQQTDAPIAENSQSQILQSDADSVSTSPLQKISLSGQLDLKLADEMTWVVVASREDQNAALELALKYISRFPSTIVTRSGNGSFAISIGWLQRKLARQFVDALVKQDALPADTFLSSGEKFGMPVWWLGRSSPGVSNDVLRGALLRLNPEELRATKSNSTVTLTNEFQFTPFEASDTSIIVGLRKKPDSEIQPTYMLPRGTMLKKISSKNDWVEVATLNGRSGWLPSKYVFKIGDSAATEESVADSNEVLAESKNALDVVQLEKLKSQARQIIEDVDGFLKSGKGSYDVATWAQKVAKTQAAIDDPNSSSLRLALEDLIQVVGKLPEFVSFKVEADKQRQQAKIAALKDQIVLATQNVVFLEAFIKENLTSSNAPEMADVLAGISTELKKDPPGLDSLTSMNKNVNSLISRERLEEFYKQSVSKVAGGAEANQTAANAIPEQLKSGASQVVFEGDLTELLVFFNATTTAPNVARNLRGDYVFKDAKANVCFIAPPLDTDVKNKDEAVAFLKLETAADVTLSEKPCPVAWSSSYDLVLGFRGDILKLPSSQAIPFLSDLQNGAYELFARVTDSKLRAPSRAQSQEIRNAEVEILKGVKSGFGFIRNQSRSSEVCIAMVSPSPGHVRAVTESADTIVSEPASTVSIKELTVDDAFLGFKKGGCKAVYADAKTLADIITASKRDKVTFELLPTWYSLEDINKLSAVVEAEIAQKEKEDAVKRQAIEDEQKLAAVRAAEAATSRSSIEKELQTKNGALARAKSDWILGVIKDQIAGKETWAGSNYPRSFEWYNRQVLDGWELVGVVGSVNDYGTAVWKSRTLETIFSDVTISMKNRTLGENKSHCFSLGIILDSEFDIVREPTEGKCDEVKDSQISWKRANGFKSQWLAEVPLN
jgi:hypothetical protein